MSWELLVLSSPPGIHRMNDFHSILVHQTFIKPRSVFPAHVWDVTSRTEVASCSSCPLGSGKELPLTSNYREDSCHPRRWCPCLVVPGFHFPPRTRHIADNSPALPPASSPSFEGYCAKCLAVNLTLSQEDRSLGS